MGAATNVAPVPEPASASGQTPPSEQLNQAGLELLQDRAIAGYRWFESFGQALELKASAVYGPMFRQIRDDMKNQGTRNDLKKKRGQQDTGFRAWLTAQKIPHTTIYSWIKEDEIRTGDRNPPKPKTPSVPLSTSYGSVLSPAPEPKQPEPGMAEECSADSASSTKPVTKKLFYCQLDAEEFDRLKHELRPLLETDNASDTVLAALRSVHHVL